MSLLSVLVYLLSVNVVISCPYKWRCSCIENVPGEIQTTCVVPDSELQMMGFELPINTSHLILRHSSLLTFPLAVFAQLPRLRVLDLKSNNIQELPYLDMKDTKIDLRDNPLDCNCNVNHFLNGERNVLTGTCAQPANMTGKPVLETLRGIKCDPEENITYSKLTFGKSLSSTVLFVQWNKVDDDDLLGYEVGYIPYVKRNKMLRIQTNKDVTSVVISGLKAFTMYEIYVRAIKYQVGQPWSKPLFLKTDEIVFTARPQNLIVQHLQPNLCILGWDEVDLTDIENGLVLGYMVRLTTPYGVRDEVVNGSESSIVLDSLQSETVYIVKVAYVSSKGIGPFSLPLYINTPEDSPCASLPCLNGGVCFESHALILFSCLCLPKYSGTRCQHYFSGSPDYATCTSPNATLPTISHSLKEATTIYRSSSLIIPAKIITSCMGEYKKIYVWKVAPVGSSLLVFESNNTENLTIPRRTLDYGRYMVNLTVKMKKYSVFNHVTGYIHIKQDSLVANIKGGPKVTKQANGRNIVLDASMSYDMGTGTSLGLTFTWLCRKADESFPDALDYPMVEIPIFFPGNVSTLPYKRGGCFGTGPGKLPENGPLMELEGYYVVANTTYVFTVIVSNRNRRVAFVQEVRVVPGSALNVSIRCLKNCKMKLDPNRKIAFRSICNDVSSCGDIHSYKWSTFYRINSSWQQIVDLQNRSETPLTSNTLILEAFSLLPGKTFRVTLTVNRTKGLPGLAEHRFTTNIGPKYGSCSVTPRSGRALETIFHFRCYNWTDTDQPISYTFKYTTSDGILHILQRGMMSDLSVTLPPGDNDNNNMLMVAVEVADSVGTYSIVSTPVQVTLDVGFNKQKFISDMTALTVGKGSVLHDLFQKGQTQNALQLSRNVLLTLKQYEHQLDADDIIQIKSAIVKGISSLKVMSLTEISAIASIIAQAMYNVDDVDHEAEMSAAKALVSFTLVLEQLGKVEPDYDTLEREAQGLVAAIGNVLRVVSYNAKFEKLKIRKDGGISSHKKVLLDLLNATERTGDVLLSKIIEGGKSSILKGDTMSLLLSKKKPKALAGSVFDDMGARFTFPNEEKVFEKGTGAVGVQMLVTNFTTFVWDKTSTKVSSLVVHMKVKDNSANEMPLKNLSSPVEIRLPQRVQHDKPTNNTYVIGFGRTVYHKVDIEDDGMSVVIKLIPQDINAKLFLAIKFQARPSRDEEFELFSFPWESVPPNRTSNLNYTYSDPHTLHICSPFKAGVHFIGIRVGLDKKNLTANQIHVKDSMDILHTEVVYKLEIRASGCLFWNQEQEKWSNYGCRVNRTTSNSVVCQCNHLTSFASQLYVAPNPIDFKKVFIEFSRLHETGNVMTFVVLGFVFGIYVVVVLWARREDKKDQMKVGLKPFLGVCTPESHKYQISVTTGIWRNSGSTAKVYIILYGDLGTSQPINLTNPSCVPFSRGNNDTFLLSFQDDLGKINKIRIWHDNSGANPSWFLSHVTIQGDGDGNVSLFIFQQWLAVEKGAGFVDRTKSVASKEDLGNFGTSFYGKLSEQFADEHLWLSIFARSPNSHFTRVQRVTCCLSLILSIMLCNAMFYEFAPKPVRNIAGSSLKVGPIRLNMRQLIVAVESALIIAPFHLLIALIFENTSVSSTELVRAKHVQFTRPRKVDKWKNSKQRRFLPGIFVYIAYFLCLLSVLASSSFIVFYSLFWGSHIANQWLITIIMSLTLDFFIAKPLALVALVLIVSLLCRWRIDKLKKPQSLEGAIFTLEDIELMKNGSFEGAHGAEFQDLLQPPDPPTRQQLRKARRLQIMNEQLYSWLWDLVILLLYIGILFAVCYGSRDKKLFAAPAFIKNSFQHHEITKVTPDTFLDFWQWSEEVLIPGIYKDEGNKSDPANFGYVLVALPKVTQKRVTNYDCRVVEQFKSMISSCTIPYSPIYEETLRFLPTWALPKSSTNITPINFTTSFQDAWTYSHTGIFFWSYIGTLMIYPSGGYVVRLGRSVEDTRRLFKDLTFYRWIDFRTAAMFVSFTLYNPYTSLFVAVKIALEKKFEGAMEITYIVQPLDFYDIGKGYEVVLLLFQLFLPFFVIYYIVEQIRKMRKGFLVHFCVVFNWVELAQICCTISWMAIHICRMVQTDINSKSLSEDIFQDNDFEEVVLLNDIENTLIAMIIFFNTLKLLLIIQFSHVKHFFGILRFSFKELLSYAIFLCVTLFAFAHFGFLVFGTNIYNFSDVFKALSQLCHIIVGGKLHLEELENTNTILGPGFFVLFALLSMIIFANAFIMILIHYYRGQIERLRHVYGLGRFIVDRVKEACGVGKTVIPDEGTDMDEIRLQCDLDQALDLSGAKKIMLQQKKKYHSLIAYKGSKYKIVHSYSHIENVRYSSCPCDKNIPQRNVDKTSMAFGSKREGRGTIFDSQARKVKPRARNAPNSVESAVSFKLDHISSLINSVYAEEVLDDIGTVLLGMTSRKQKEKLPQSITAMFETNLTQEPLPQSTAEIFGTNLAQEPLPQSIAEIFGTNSAQEP